MKFISKRSSKNTSFDRVSVRLKIVPKPTSGMLHPGGGGVDARHLAKGC